MKQAIKEFLAFIGLVIAVGMAVLVFVIFALFGVKIVMVISKFLGI